MIELSDFSEVAALISLGLGLGLVAGYVFLLARRLQKFRRELADWAAESERLQTQRFKSCRTNDGRLRDAILSLHNRLGEIERVSEWRPRITDGLAFGPDNPEAN